MAPRAKKKAAKKTKPKLKAVPSASLPQSANIPEGMKQMGGGYAPTWTPVEIGDSIHGYVTELPKEMVLNKGTKKENQTRVMEVTNLEGERFAVWDSAVLTTLFDAIEEGGELEVEVYIEYTGLGKKKPGQNPPKLFTVAMAE